MPYTTRYGVIGAVFAMISALFCVMVAVVGSAAAGREIRDELDRIRRGGRPAEDEVRRQWNEVTTEARSRWETLRLQIQERRRRRDGRLSVRGGVTRERSPRLPTGTDPRGERRPRQQAARGDRPAEPQAGGTQGPAPRLDARCWCLGGGAVGRLRKSWDTYDLLTPSGVRVEVKASSYLQSWPQPRLSRLRFGKLTGRGDENTPRPT